MPQLDPTWFASQLFWLVISLGLLHLVLSRSILPSLMGVLEQRRSIREQDLASAQRLKNEAEAAKQEYETALAAARHKAQAIFAESEAAHKQAAEKALADLNRTLNAKISEAEKRVATGKDELMRAIEPQLADLVALAVEKLIDRRPDDKRVQSVLQRILSS